jgi:hypothetical protein
LCRLVGAAAAAHVHRDLVAGEVPVSGIQSVLSGLDAPQVQVGCRPGAEREQDRAAVAGPGRTAAGCSTGSKPSWAAAACTAVIRACSCWSRLLNISRSTLYKYVPEIREGRAALAAGGQAALVAAEQEA